MFSKTLITAILGYAGIVNAIPTTAINTNNEISTRDAAVSNAKMTWYYPGLGACGQNHGDGDLVVAVDPTVYGNWPNPNLAPICNRKMRVNYQGRWIGATSHIHKFWTSASFYDNCITSSWTTLGRVGAGDGDIVATFFFHFFGSLAADGKTRQRNEGIVV